MTDGELRNQRREVERAIQIHAARDHLVDGVGQLVAADPVRPGITPDPRPHRGFLLRARDAGLDRDVANDRLIVRGDRRRHCDGSRQLHRIADHAATGLLPGRKPLAAGHFQIQPASGSTELRIRAIEPADLDASVSQRFQIAVELAANAVRRAVTRRMQATELVLQAHRLADLALPEPRVVRPLLHRVDLRRRVGDRLPERCRDGPADHDAKR
ncbi:hypothetical protein [Burkholderia cenocepacia]|uniref:hypothetical protein n=1 Tax=Burkholderia cenocepacia TaxID=95486 RepID=UPI0020132FAC|nr:hypothetical protein [Burkholderia cenocepacia]